MFEHGWNSFHGPGRFGGMTNSNGDGLAGLKDFAENITQGGRLLDRSAYPGPGDKRDELGVVDATADVLVGQHLATALAIEMSRRVGALAQIQRCFSR